MNWCFQTLESSRPAESRNTHIFATADAKCNARWRGPCLLPLVAIPGQDASQLLLSQCHLTEASEGWSRVSGPAAAPYKY